MGKMIPGTGFWSSRLHLVKEQMLPLQLRNLKDEQEGAEPSHAVDNLRITAGQKEGVFHGFVFQDSDLAKWLEAAAYSLMIFPDAALEADMDEIIGLIAASQQKDGYFNTYFTLKEPELRWKNLRECHELYVAGHLMEAAVAHHAATGKKTLLDVVCRLADHIDEQFGEGKLRGYPGHPEIELALYRLYETTGEERYARLADFFIDERGQKPFYFEEEIKTLPHTHWGGIGPDNDVYAQWHQPVREQRDAAGHSVRALYLYAGMADEALRTGDKALLKALDTLWQSAVNKRMYITGGFGATRHGERFMADYELPNDTAYAETCASVAFVFLAKRMLKLKREGAIADEMERALYNCALSGMQLDGSKFYYVNQLESVVGLSGQEVEYEHALPQRVKWFGCACCPPNLARLILSLDEYAYSVSQNTLNIHLYLDGTVTLPLATISHTGNYPWQGDLRWVVTPGENAQFAVALRIPGWAKEYGLTVNSQPVNAELQDGYAVIDRAWQPGDEIRLMFDMPVRRVYANAAVRADAGQVALMRGPLVYCFEGEDNGGMLHALSISRDAEITAAYCTEGALQGMITLALPGQRDVQTDALYSEKPPAKQEAMLTAIPYFAWANRSLTDMRVWMREC